MSAVEAVDIDLIDLRARLRPVDEAAIPALAASLTKEGLLQPIGVRRSGQLGQRLTLIWGAHRLMAAQRLGWGVIQARVYGANDMPEGVSATELEALENLSRAELSPYDRAITVKALLDEMRRAAGLVEGQDGRATNAANFDGPNNDPPKSVNFIDLVAQRIGRSVPAVDKDIALVKSLKPEAASLMRGREGWDTASVVMACAKICPQLIDPMDRTAGYVDGQEALVAWLLAHPKGTLKEALSALAPKSAETLSADDKAVNTVKDSFARLPSAVQVTVAAQLIADLTPAQRAQLKAHLDDDVAGDA